MPLSFVPIMPSFPAVQSLSVDHHSSVAYPRTGKRGVPQQFARRLYEMLQSEASLASSTSSPPDDEIFIQWSESGLAFRILDVKGFAETVLPKYFRTKKFSSFQRNLNLYGFAKVRRGPDTDMYAHPSFVRGKPELLSHLRKCMSAASRRKTSRSVAGDDSDASTATSGSCGNSRRSRSSVSVSVEGTSPQVVTPVTPPKIITERLDLTKASDTVRSWANFQNRPLMPKTFCQPQTPAALRGGIGRLDLLALAVEHAA